MVPARTQPYRRSASAGRQCGSYIDTTSRVRKLFRQPSTRAVASGRVAGGHQVTVCDLVDARQVVRLVSGIGRRQEHEEQCAKRNSDGEEPPVPADRARTVRLHRRGQGSSERVARPGGRRYSSPGRDLRRSNSAWRRTMNSQISGDGHVAAFGTVASNLIPDDANGFGFDIAVAQLSPP